MLGGGTDSQFAEEFVPQWRLENQGDFSEYPAASHMINQIDMLNSVPLLQGIIRCRNIFCIVIANGFDRNSHQPGY